MNWNAWYYILVLRLVWEIFVFAYFIGLYKKLNNTFVSIFICLLCIYNAKVWDICHNWQMSKANTILFYDNKKSFNRFNRSGFKFNGIRFKWFPLNLMVPIWGYLRCCIIFKLYSLLCLYLLLLQLSFNLTLNEC